MIEIPVLNIPLDNIPNQSFSMTIDNDFYNIIIKETNGVMSCTIIRNNVFVIQNSRITPSYFLIPYYYKESGNFFMITKNDDYPSYDRFDVDQYLLYVSQETINNLRGVDLNTIETGF